MAMIYPLYQADTESHVGHRSASAVRCPSLPGQFDSKVSYLLIAYPLDKLWALSAFGGGKWRQRVEELVTNPRQRLLLVQGTQDQFTKSAVSTIVSWPTPLNV